MSRRIPKESAQNETGRKASYQETGSLQELAGLAYSYCLQVLSQARIQFCFSLILMSSVFCAELLWLFINRSISPSLALSLMFNPVLVSTFYHARRTLQRADDISRLILAIRLAMLIDDKGVRNSTLSEFVKQLAAFYSSSGRKKNRKESSEPVARVIEEYLKSLDRRFTRTN